MTQVSQNIPLTIFEKNWKIVLLWCITYNRAMTHAYMKLESEKWFYAPSLESDKKQMCKEEWERMNLRFPRPSQLWMTTVERGGILWEQKINGCSSTAVTINPSCFHSASLGACEWSVIRNIEDQTSYYENLPAMQKIDRWRAFLKKNYKSAQKRG